MEVRSGVPAALCGGSTQIWTGAQATVQGATLGDQKAILWNGEKHAFLLANSEPQQGVQLGHQLPLFSSARPPLGVHKLHSHGQGLWQEDKTSTSQFPVGLTLKKNFHQETKGKKTFGPFLLLLEFMLPDITLSTPRVFSPLMAERRRRVHSP